MFSNREVVARMIRHGVPDAAAGIDLLRTQLAAFWASACASLSHPRLGSLGILPDGSPG